MVAVQELVIDDGKTVLPHLLTSRLQPDPQGQAIFGGQRSDQVEDVVASAVGQAVEVQMSPSSSEGTSSFGDCGPHR